MGTFSGRNGECLVEEMGIAEVSGEMVEEMGRD